MRCEDIEKYLNSDNGDLDEVLKHLDICPACAEKYFADIELESALRRLSLTSETVDITDNLKSTLYYRYRQQSRLRLIRKWVWITISFTVTLLLIISLPAIIEWLNRGYNSFINELAALKFADSLNIGQLAEKAESSRYYGYVVFLVLAFFVGISAYLWREYKEIIS